MNSICVKGGFIIIMNMLIMVMIVKRMTMIVFGINSEQDLDI